MDFLQPMKISVYALAQAIKVPRSRVNDIVLGRRGITADTAFRRELMKSQAAPQSSPAPAAPQASPSPVASAAPNSGAGVLPAGSAPPAASPSASAKP